MAPEQARGEVVDGRADLYSVGVLAYELLMGRLPYQAADPLALALMHAQDPVPRLPPEKKHWQPFLDRAMAKSPDNRYRNAQQMLSALNQIANGKPAEPAVDLARLQGAIAPYWKPALAALGGVAVVALTLAWFMRDRPAAPPENDFFTVEDRPAAVAPATPAPAPEPAPATESPPAPEAAVDAPTPAGAFGQVSAEVTVTALDYDPTRAGARELAAARRQIDRQRLSLPPGDNAMASLRAARALAPGEPAIARLSDEVVAFYAGRVVAAVEAGKDQDALDDHARVAPFVEDMERAQGKPWTDMRAALVPALLARLQAGLDQVDADAVARTKSLAGTLGIDSTELEPAWSQAVQLPKAGDPIDDNGVAMVLVSLPRDGRPGLAAMRAEVTRGEYAAFDAASGRADARCRNRLAPISLKRRSWDDPGFSQAGTHPVVCVSFDDARAFAQWLGRRNGKEYRLPTRAEWVPLATYRGTGNACRDGRIDCGSAGTVAASQGPASHLGLTGMRGNAREWLSDCDRGCARRLVGGVGWRDPAARANPQGTNDFDADTGFDDIGFRLVREVSAEELGAR
jgi:formylglycine-generating enzyme required for sulfatase activity